MCWAWPLYVAISCATSGSGRPGRTRRCRAGSSSRPGTRDVPVGGDQGQRRWWPPRRRSSAARPAPPRRSPAATVPSAPEPGRLEEVPVAPVPSMRSFHVGLLLAGASTADHGVRASQQRHRDAGQLVGAEVPRRACTPRACAACGRNWPSKSPGVAGRRGASRRRCIAAQALARWPAPGRGVRAARAAVDRRRARSARW